MERKTSGNEDAGKASQDVASATLVSLIWQLDGWTAQFGDQVPADDISNAKSSLASLLNSISKSDPQTNAAFDSLLQKGIVAEAQSKEASEEGSEQEEEEDAFEMGGATFDISKAPLTSPSFRRRMTVRLGIPAHGFKTVQSSKTVPEDDAGESGPHSPNELQKMLIEENRKPTTWEKIRDFVPVILEDSPQRLCWDVYMMVLILYYAVAVPVRVGFDIDPPNPQLENFFSLCFGFDMLFNFNTAVKVKGELSKDRWTIAKTYFFTWFWIDFIASFPFEVLLPSTEDVEVAVTSVGFNDTVTMIDGGTTTSGVNKLGRLGKIFRLLRIFKLLRLFKLGRIMKRMKSLTEGNPNFVTLIKTLVSMGFMLHLTACGYWFIVMSEGRSVRTDLEESGFNQWHPPEYIVDPCMSAELVNEVCSIDNFELQYAYAFFWGVSVTMGVGWDIIPGTKAQVAFSSIFIVIGALIYITLLGTVTTIVANFNAEHTRRLAKLESLLSYLKKRMVPKAAFKKVREYYEFMWEGGSASAQPQQQLESLPASMQIQLASEMHKSLLSQIPVFRNLRPEASFFLVKNWARVLHLPNDVVVKRIGEDERLYIVIRGKVRLFLVSSDQRRRSVISREELETKEVAKVERLFLSDLYCGNYFGERAMIGSLADKNEKRQTAVAVTHSELLYITKEIFIQLVEKFRLQKIVEGVVRTYRSRKARTLWRVAIAKVRVVVRLTRLAKLSSAVPEIKTSRATILSFSSKSNSRANYQA